jgi:integrase
MNKQTANEYYARLSNFERFLVSQYGNNLDSFVKELKNGNKFDVYEIIGNYSIYLYEKLNLHTTTLKQRIITAKNFLEFHDIDISPRKFKLKIRLPKNVKRSKESIDKNDIVLILNGCSDLRLKTYVMLLASTGARATESLSIRNRDLRLELNPPRIMIKGEYTKTKVDRYIFLTNEMKEQLIKWQNFKYRKRRVCYKDPKTGKSIEEYRTPEDNPNDFVFSLRKSYYNFTKKRNENLLPNSRPQNNYNNMTVLFGKNLDRIGLGSREDGNEGRRNITLHSFRRFVKSTISDLGYADYSEWFIGHAGSEYWKRKDSEKSEIFRKIEPYLTFLDIQQLERKGSDMQSQIQELQEVNQVLRNREQMREEKDRKSIERLSQLEARFEEITAKFDIEKKQERDYETTPIEDFETKDSKFEKYQKTRRYRMKQERALIDSIKEE